MGRRILAFFLGFIFAFLLIGGAVAIAVFAIKVNQYAPESDKYLGDLADMSVYGIGQSIYKLYADKKTWTDENGKYYSLGNFCENYNIDVNQAFGMELPQEILDIPAFEFFNEGGMDNAMKQIKVSTLPIIVNLFGGKTQEGMTNGTFGDDVVAELSKFSMFDLLKDESVGISGVFANVRIAQLLPDSFPAEDSDNKLMWAVGQTKIGGLLDGMSGSDSILLQLKAGGAFETLGGLELSAILGESQYVDALMGSNAVFADLIADDGTIRLDDIINGVSVGELLGCQKNKITDVTGYAAIEGQSADAETKVMSKTLSEGESAVTTYVMGVNGEEWFEAELKCENADEGHTHNADCFKYVWYSTAECTSTEHNHENNGDMNKDGVWYARTEGLYAVLAALSITDLTSGNTDALMDEIKVIKISDIIDVGNVNGIMNAFVELTIEELMNGAIDDMYLGEFFSFERKAIQNLNEYDAENAFAVYKERDNSVLAYYVMWDGKGNIALSLNNKDWYAGKCVCENTDPTHDHNENCYAYLWYTDQNALAEGVQNKLANKQIADLQYLNDEVLTMTLNDVFGESIPQMLKSIADVEIGKLSTAIDKITLGELLGYEGGLICENTDESHVHGYECYVWTNNGETVTGMMAKLACKAVGKMSDLTNTIKTFTLRDVLGDGIPDMLKSLADKGIGELNDAIDNMYLGDFLEYEKRYVCGITEEGHEHGEGCRYAWYQLKCTNTDEGHEHGDECYAQVDGMMAKLADKKVSELNTLDDFVQTLTLRDVLGDNIPAMLKDVADTKVSKVGEAIQDIYLGSALNYARKKVDKDIAVEYDLLSDTGVKPYVRGSVPEKVYYMSEDGETWYEASRTLKNKQPVYGYVWYETDESGNITATAVTGIVKALVNSKVGNVSSSIETMTLGEMGIGEGNRILEALQDTQINGIGDAINDMKMATVLGYTKKFTCGHSASNTEHSLATCPYVWIDENSEEVKGLNAKIAEKTISEMSGDSLTAIALDLTIGDLIDSGMISLGETAAQQEENTYKLALMFSNGEHRITINGEPKYACNTVDYLQYSTTVERGISKKEYWLRCHGITNEHTMSEEDIAHRDSWKTQTLKVFITQLLNVI